MKVLIAEPNAADRLILESIISQAKHETLTASNGQEALELVDKEDPDLILTEVLMPQLDGLELATILHKRERFIPIIFLTSLTDSESLVECIEAGGIDFLPKPYNRVVLKAKLLAIHTLMIKTGRASDQYGPEHSPINQTVSLLVKGAKRPTADIIHLFESYARVHGFSVQCKIDTFQKGVLKYRVHVDDQDDEVEVTHCWKHYIQSVQNGEIPELPNNLLDTDKYTLAMAVIDDFNRQQQLIKQLEGKNEGLLLSRHHTPSDTNVTIVNAPQNNNIQDAGMEFNNGTFSHCTFADKIDEVTYKAKGRWDEATLTEAKRVLTALAEPQLSGLQAASKNGGEKGVNEYVSEHGIPVAHSLIASGLFQALTFMLTNLSKIMF